MTTVVKSYWSEGKINMVAPVNEDGEYHGLMEIYSINQTIDETKHYVNGVPQGPWIIYFPSIGLPEEIYDCVNGFIKGRVQEFTLVNKIHCRRRDYFLNDSLVMEGENVHYEC